MDSTKGMTLEQVQKANTMQGGAAFLQDEITKILTGGGSFDQLFTPEKTYTVDEVIQLVRQALKTACRRIDDHCRNCD
jgi:hypothetical protein